MRCGEQMQMVRHHHEMPGLPRLRLTPHLHQQPMRLRAGQPRRSILGADGDEDDRRMAEVEVDTLRRFVPAWFAIGFGDGHVVSLRWGEAPSEPSHPPADCRVGNSILAEEVGAPRERRPTEVGWCLLCAGIPRCHGWSFVSVASARLLPPTARPNCSPALRPGAPVSQPAWRGRLGELGPLVFTARSRPGTCRRS